MKSAVKDYNLISEVLNSQSDENLLIALESFIQAYREEATKKENVGIPLSMYSYRNLGVLEVTVKYLKESLSLKYSKIAEILNRDDRTIWTAHNISRQKHKDKFLLKDNQYIIPCSIFSNRKLGPLEALTVYAHDNLKLHFTQISKLLNRHYRTIWLSYQNGMRKSRA